jgi:hypothetical protein
MRFIGRKLRRMAGWAALLLWPALLPQPANAVAGCIWYSVLGLSALVYFLSRVQDNTEQAETLPTGDPGPSADPASSSRVPASTSGTSGQA